MDQQYTAEGVAFREAGTRARSIRIWDWIALGSLAALAVIMPYAHTGTLRSTLFAVAIVGWVGRWYTDPSWRWVKTPVDLPLLLFVLWSIVALVTALDVPYSAREIKNELLANAVLFVLAASAVRQQRAIEVVAWVMSLAGLVLSVKGVMEFGWTPELLATRSMRSSSFTSDPIFFSSYLVLVIPSAFYLAITTKRLVGRSAAWAIWAVQMLAMISTVTRAAWLAVALQFFVYGLVKSRRVLIAWGIVVAAGAAVFVFNSTLRQEVAAGDWLNDYGRTAYWENLLPHLADSPVTGFGYGQGTPARAAPGVRGSTPGIDAKHAFNSFLQILLELGFVGLGLFCWVLWRAGKELWFGFREAPTNSADSVWLVCIFMVLAGFILRNQFDHLFRDSPGHLFWILMGLGVGRAVSISGRADGVR